MGNYGCRSCHDDVPTVHSASTCPDYGSPAVHSTSACPEFCSLADDGSADTSPDYLSPAMHWGSTNTGTNQHGERCLFQNQHDQRCVLSEQRHRVPGNAGKRQCVLQSFKMSPK